MAKVRRRKLADNAPPSGDAATNNVSSPASEPEPMPAASPVPESAEETWSELTRLGEDIAQGWRSAKTSTEQLSDMRR